MIAYLDCSTGVSGDKLLGALVDAGLDPRSLTEALRGMGLEAVSIELSERASAGVRGVGVRVIEAGAPRRDWRELRTLLEGADLSPTVRDGALSALRALAEAEAHVHALAPDDVHFHEIGAADTLADTLGVALGLEALGIRELVASPVAVGRGTVTTEHGELAVPTPATALLLDGMPIAPGAASGELTTPTGAALLATFVTRFGAVPAMTVRRTGTGCGMRDLGMPNVCRLLIGEPITQEAGHDAVVVLESNIDHLTPEELAIVADRLREAGALDVWQAPIVMKKGRAAVMLSVLAGEQDAPRLAERVITEAGTLGVRVLPADRRLVERDVSRIATSLGTARFKIAIMPGEERVLRVESDDAARIAAERGLPVAEAVRVLEHDAALATGVQPMRQRPPSDTTKPSD